MDTPIKQAKQHIRNAHDHIQISDADATDPNIIAALGEILDAIRLLTKEADDVNVAINRMAQP